MNVSAADFKAAMISFQRTGERPAILDTIPVVLPQVRRRQGPAQIRYPEYVRMYVGCLNVRNGRIRIE
jgi:hypothetical protein